MAWIYKLTLQGHSEKDYTTMTFDLGDPADHVAALAAAVQVKGALVDITNAFVSREVLSQVLSEDDTRPAAGINVFSEAVVTTYLNATGTKKHAVRIPAPIEALFSAGDAQTVITSNALLIQYVQQLSQHTFVSDNESIDTTITDGIKSGYKRSKKRLLKGNS